MAQWSRAMAAAAEDPESVPSTHKAAHKVCNSSSGGSEALLWPLKVPSTYKVQTYTQVKHQIRIIIKEGDNLKGINLYYLQHNP